MYFSSIEIENEGPIERLQIDFPIDEGRPKPVVIVGENGTGKSIFISHLVNSLIVGKSMFFDDGDVTKGKLYKLVSPSYITSGKGYSYSSLKFDSGIICQELQLNTVKVDSENIYNFFDEKNVLFQKIGKNESAISYSTFGAHPDATNAFFKKQCCLYFPANRFEEAAWLNLNNLKSPANYSDLKRTAGNSNRSIICSSPLKRNRDWLLDLIFDREVFDLKCDPMCRFSQSGKFYLGKSTNTYESVLSILRAILNDQGNNIRLGAETRKHRQISVMKDERVWVPNLFQLSTGEIQLLNLSLSIIRDYDLSDGTFNKMADIKGIVIIDEIDSHLHFSHQKEVLPELIASFPNVQFIITTHSPLFLMGMDQKFGSENFVIFNMPGGEQITPSDFSEFDSAYQAFRETSKFREELRLELEKSTKHLVFVEGDYDVRYLEKAALLLDKVDILNRVQLEDGGGFGNLDNIWRAYDVTWSKVFSGKIILLYDCDTNKINNNKGRIYKRIMSVIENNPINNGIENLFSKDTIDRISNAQPEFIDTEEARNTRVSNKPVPIPAKTIVNKGNKGNLCTWLCENGDENDFAGFLSVFQLIEDIINS